MTDLWWPSLVASTLVWAVMTCKWANVSLSIARDAKRLNRLGCHLMQLRSTASHLYRVVRKAVQLARL